MGETFPWLSLVSPHLGSGVVYVLIYVYVQIVGFFLFACFTLSAVDVETMSLREMGPQLKLPINVTNGSMPLQCNTYF